MPQITDVELWLIESGIGHVIVAENIPGTGWTKTLCNRIGPFRRNERTSTAPKRICRECREALPLATLTPETFALQ